jgi:hypothetical protein
MPRRVRSIPLAWMAVSVLLASACSPVSRRPLTLDERPLPALSATREELMTRLAGLQAGIRTLTGTSVGYVARSLGLTTDFLDESREAEGYLLAERPDQIRMRGTAPLGVGTIFDMVSDRSMFRVSLPTRNEFIAGTADSVTCSDNPILNLRPQHIMDALFVDVTPFLEDPDVTYTLEEVREGRQSFYVVSFIDIGPDPASLVEKIWIDRLDLGISRRQIFGPDGALATDVRYNDWEEAGTDLFPRRIVVERPADDYSLEIVFRELRTNDVPVENAFLLEEPPGARLISADAGSENCRN